MSTVDVRPVHQVADRADYLECGLGEKRAMHKAAGTDRLAVMFCSTGSIDAFVERGESLAEQHGRTVQAQSYLQNFERHEFDVDKTEDLLRVNDLGFLLAQRMHPDSHVLVVTHDDADGGHAHNHIVVLNHDNKTGRALKKYRTHASVKKVNDELMREQRLRTATDRQHEITQGLEPGGQRSELTPASTLARELRSSVRVSQATYWARKHGKLAADEQSWDERLADAITTAMLEDKVTDDDSLASNLRSIAVEGAPADQQGVVLVTSDEHDGTTFEMYDPELGSRRRRSASKISPKLTTHGRKAFFAEKAAQVQVATRRATTAELYARAMGGASDDTSWHSPDLDLDSILRDPYAASAAPLVQPAPLSLTRSQGNADVRQTRDGVTTPGADEAEVHDGTAENQSVDSPTADVAEELSSTADHEPGLRTLTARDEGEQRKLRLMIALDETWAPRLEAGNQVDATFEQLATEAGVGRVLLDGRIGQVLHPAVRGRLEARELAKISGESTFEWAKKADGDEFRTRMKRHKQVREATKAGDYELAIRLAPDPDAAPDVEESIQEPEGVYEM